MKVLRVSKASGLRGELKIQGSKNACLPMIVATLLSKETVVLHNCPRITDVYDMIGILKQLGCIVSFNKHSLEIFAGSLNSTVVDEVHAGRLRASILLLGALIGRCGVASIAYPGGCDIGNRPVDIHIAAFRQLGIKIEECRQGILAKGNVRENDITLRYPSVGATENLILASVCVDGIVKIEGAAREPEIVALCELLNAMGADINGAGEHIITIRGVRRLHGAEFEIPGDRIVAGTYALATIAVGGDIRIEGLKAADLSGQYAIMSKTNAKMKFRKNIWCIEGNGKPDAVGLVRTEPFPCFPTDLQSPFMAAMLKGNGCTRIVDTVYPDRFSVVNEFRKMGADIVVDKDGVNIFGVSKLNACELNGTELRGMAGLVIAGLEAESDSFITGLNFLERGYEDIGRDLKVLGADVNIISR